MKKSFFALKSSPFYKIILTIILTSVVYTTIAILSTTSILNKTILSIEKSSGKSMVEKIVEMVQNTNDNLKTFKTYEINSQKDSMKNLVNIMSSFIEQTINSSKNKQAAKEKIFEIVSNIKQDNSNNYFFIADYNNKMLAHPYLRGKDLSNLRDIHGKLIVPSIIKTAKTEGSGFLEYYWKQNSNDNKMYKKIVYVKNMPQFKFVVGTGIYIKDIDKVIAARKAILYKKIEKTIRRTRIGKSGYIYIFNNKGFMLFHPNSNIENTNFKNLKDPKTHNSIFNELVKAAHTTHELQYKWDKTHDKGHYIHDKISWVYYYPNLKWYIASSAYIKDLNLPIQDIKKYMTLTTLLFLFIVIIFAFIIFKNILLPIHNLAEISKEVTNGNYTLRSTYKKDDEIGILSKEFNNMIDTIEKNIKTLDIKVEEKTKELQKALNYANMIFINAGTGIMIVDKNRNIQNINPILCRLLGYSKNELIGKNTAMLHIDQKSYEERGETTFKPAQTKLTNQEIIPLRRKDGSVIWLSVYGAPLSSEYVIWSMSDYTETYRNEEQIKSKNAQLESLLNAQSNIMFIVENCSIILSNKTMRQTFNTDIFQKISENTRYFKNLFVEYENSYIPKTDNWIKEILQLQEEQKIIAFDNKYKETKIFKIDIKTFDIDSNSYLISLNDITDMTIETQVLKEQASTDPLTGALNRRRFMQIAEEEKNKTKVNKLSFSLLMFDIDHFKKINDTYGHDIGDRVLQELSSFINSMIRKEDIFARWGGEEFMILMPNTALTLSTQKADTIRKAIEKMSIENIPKFTVSFGVSCYHMNESIETLIKRVDKALYKAKNDGRNKTVSIS